MTTPVSAKDDALPMVLGAIDEVLPQPSQASDMPAVFLHIAIFLGDANHTVLSDETFRLVSFSGSEGVSEPFEYHLELHANDNGSLSRFSSTDPLQQPWSFDDLVGRPMTFAVDQPAVEDDGFVSDLAASGARFREAVGIVVKDGCVVAGSPSSGTTASTAGNLAYFNGIVAAFGMSATLGVYRLTVRPALWQLTLSNRYAILPQCSITGAIQQTLARYAIDADFSAADGIAQSRVQDWFQAGESDYQFVQRLMGKAHLYYYFRHAPTVQTVVFSNRAAYSDDVCVGRQFRYANFTDASALGLSRSDVVTDVYYEQQLGIAAVDARFVQESEAWQGDETMRQNPIVTYSALRGAQQASVRAFDLCKVYQHGCSEDVTDDFARKTLSAARASTRQLSGQAYCAAFRVGHRFQMGASTCPAAEAMPIRPQLEQRAFVLTKVEHQASLDGGYRNTFQATDTSGLIARFSLEDTQQGSLLAVVVSHQGDEQTEGGNFLYQQDFDPETGDYKIDGGSGTASGSDTVQGVYVVFATDWPNGDACVFVKLGAYMQSVPNIGALVLVSRASDETELPELQQIVHGEGSMTVTPSKWTANTTVGNAYSTRYCDGQNVSYGQFSAPDLPAATQIVATAYGAGGQYRDASYSQGASYSFSTADSSASNAAQDLSSTFGDYGSEATDLLSVSESFGSTFGRSKGNVQSNVSDYDVGYSSSKFNNVTNKTQVTGVSTNHSFTGVEASMQLVGNSNNFRTVGFSTDLSITGSSVSTQLAANTNSLRATGLSTDIGATGVGLSLQVGSVNTSVSMYGEANNVSVAGTGINCQEGQIQIELKDLALHMPLVAKIVL